MTKKILFALFRTEDFNTLTSVAKFAIMSAINDSISHEKFQENEKEFWDTFGRIFSGIELESREISMIAINQLREFSKKHGTEPTESESGYYHALRALDDIGEFVISISANWKR